MYLSKKSIARLAKTVTRQIFVVFTVMFLCLPKIGFCHCDEQFEISYCLEEDSLPVPEEGTRSSVNENHRCACCEQGCTHVSRKQSKNSISSSRFSDLFAVRDEVRIPCCVSDTPRILNAPKRLSKQSIHVLYGVFLI